MTDYEEHYRVKVGNYKFNVSIYVKDQRGIYQQFTVLIGGAKKGCVEITGGTEPNDDMYKRLIDHTKATIAHVTYAKTCSLERELEQGVGTRTMVKFALNFVKQRFPHVTSFMLQDSSNFMCDNRWIDLSHYNIALYSKTWYERNFNAKLPDREAYAAYLKHVEYFSKEERKTSVEAFINVYAKEQDNDVKFKEIFKETSTYNEFFKRLKDEHHDFCQVTYKWLSKFVTDQVQFTDKWIITEVPMMEGAWSIEERLVSAPVYSVGGYRGGAKPNSDLIDWRYE